MSGETATTFIADALQRLSSEISVMRKEAHEWQSESRERFVAVETQVKHLSESVKAGDLTAREVNDIRSAISGIEREIASLRQAAADNAKNAEARLVEKLAEVDRRFAEKLATLEKAFEKATADYESRLRPLEATRWQALAIAGVAAVLVSLAGRLIH